MAAIVIVVAAAAVSARTTTEKPLFDHENFYIFIAVESIILFLFCCVVYVICLNASAQTLLHMFTVHVQRHSVSVWHLFRFGIGLFGILFTIPHNLTI